MRYATEQNAFNRIRAAHFPRWKAGERDWSLVVGHRSAYTGEDGSCDSENRTIYIKPALSGTRLDLVLIHEMAHAVTNSGHGKLFLGRLWKAAERARSLGETELAGLLDDEHEMWANAPTVRAADIYGAFCDAAREVKSFDAAVLQVASQYGLTVEEITTRYPRAQSVFDTEKAFQASCLPLPLSS